MEKKSHKSKYTTKKPQKKLKLVYEDNGIGIPNAEKEKIFQGYGKNTGYGLYLIKKYAKYTTGTYKKQANKAKEHNSH